MQFKKSPVVEVLIMLYLSTDSLCYYIPEGKPTAIKKNGTSSDSEQIQICGNALTTFVIEACDGILGSFNQANSNRSGFHPKITEDCCDQGCTLDYFQSYCGKTPLFAIKKSFRGMLLNKLTNKRSNSSGENGGILKKSRKKEVSEVRVLEKKFGKKRRKKRKKSLKRKCAYKSFGHYLLKLERKGRVHHNTTKVSNSINRTWPSIEIGTISPEVDKFGGQPIIVVRKNKSKSS